MTKGAAVAGSTVVYARGHLVVWTKKAEPGHRAPSLAELVETRFVKIAIANPEHAPYGRAAQQALTKAGVWESVKPKVVFGENVQQAMQLAETGNADVAIVGLSLAITSAGDYTPIDEALHDPLDQAMALCSRAASPDAARQFTAFVSSEPGRAIMKRYGFLLPGESVANSP